MAEGGHASGGSESGGADSGAAGALTYASYLAIDELLSLQRPKTQPEHPDELLFIVVHQTSELWFKVILHELDALIGNMSAGDALAAAAAIKRVNALVRIVTSQLSALDTLPPNRFAQFRAHLGTSSGSQSEQFRAIEAVSGLRDPHFLQVLAEHGDTPPLVARALQRPTLQDLFDEMVRRHGVTLEQVYTGHSHLAQFLVAEGLLEYEQSFALWRFLHVQLVERIIGPATEGTGGTLGARYLRRTIDQRFFPKLWEVRGRFFGEAERER